MVGGRRADGQAGEANLGRGVGWGPLLAGSSKSGQFTSQAVSLQQNKPGGKGVWQTSEREPGERGDATSLARTTCFVVSLWQA